MTEFNWLEATPRERDAWIAEHVMGWEDVRVPMEYQKWMGRPPSEADDETAVPHYTTDAGDDYLVRWHVRREWNRRDADRWSGLIEDQLQYRVSLGKASSVFLAEEPGDASYAAFKTITGQ